ncbi:MAG: patatin-like phospholipase family protein [Candidatus Omnitrophota bacterium]
MIKEITKSLDKFLAVSNMPLFKDLPINEKIFVANRSQIVEYSRRDILYRKGDPRNYLFCVLTGRVALFEPGRTDKEKRVIELVGKNEYFGLISLLTKKPHSVSAEAVYNARILRIDCAAFEEIMKKIPRLALHFSATLSRRLKNEYTGEKTVFQSAIIAVYSGQEGPCVTDYANELAQSIVRESGKKVLILRINKKADPLPPAAGVGEERIGRAGKKEIISQLTGAGSRHHFVILDVPAEIGPLEKTALQHSDSVHVIASGRKGDELRVKGFLDGYAHDRSDIKIIIKEDKGHSGKVSERYRDVLSMGIFATLPEGEEEYRRAVRRIARDISGVLVGLALGSGGAFGLAEIGVLQALEEAKIPVDIVAGTSIGAIVGAFWVCGFTGHEIERIFAKFSNVLDTLGLVDIVIPARGLISGRNIRGFLKKHLGDKTFYDIKRPFKVIACSITSREEVVISSGSIVDAVMASIAIPGVFNPQEVRGKGLLVDGGIVTPVPVGVLSRHGAKTIVAVNCMPSPEDAIKGSTERQTIVDIIVNSFYSMEYRIAKYACGEADIYIHPILKDAAWYEFHRIKEFVRFGKKEAEKIIPQLTGFIKRGGTT